MKEQILFTLFQRQHIDYQNHHHKPIFTTDEAQQVFATIAGAHSKNLFVKDKKKNFFLFSVLEHKRVNLNALAKKLAKGSFTFANADELQQKLHLIPGNVTPYGLIFDNDNMVQFFLDHDFLNFNLVNFHPLRNDMTVSVSTDLFLKFFEQISHAPTIIEIPELMKTDVA